MRSSHWLAEAIGATQKQTPRLHDIAGDVLVIVGKMPQNAVLECSRQRSV